MALFTPELALMEAVLRDAIACLNKTAPVKNERDAELESRRARAWIERSDWQSPFSFNNVCTALGLRPNAVRERALK